MAVRRVRLAFWGGLSHSSLHISRSGWVGDGFHMGGRIHPLLSGQQDMASAEGWRIEQEPPYGSCHGHGYSRVFAGQRLKGSELQTRTAIEEGSVSQRQRG